jgi:hypothetical protein
VIFLAKKYVPKKPKKTVSFFHSRLKKKFIWSKLCFFILFWLIAFCPRTTKRENMRQSYKKNTVITKKTKKPKII